MTVSINSVAAQGITAAGADAGPTAVAGGGILPTGASQALAGGAVPQTGGIGSIVRSALIGAAGGAAAGAGYGLLAGAVTFLPTVTVPMGALIGAGAGAALGILRGVMTNRRETLALRQQQTMMQQYMAPMPLPATKQAAPAAQQQASGPSGPTFKPGESGSEVRNTQRRLRILGIYRDNVTGRMDDATVAAIRRYELMKGAAPTGLSTPELRRALHADARQVRQYA